MNKSWIKVPFIYLLIVAVLGVFLRLMFFFPIGHVNFKFVLHAHSHVALLGWLYSAFYILLIKAFLSEEDQKRKTFRVQFWLSQIAVVGMLCSFPVQGYGLVSIAFSTLHILLSYWFAYSFLKAIRGNEMAERKHKLSISFVRWALFFMVLSSIGPWAMGPIMVSGRSGTDLYYLAIYFYLHFQYNGWFVLAVFGLFFWFLETNNIVYSQRMAKRFFVAIVGAAVPSYALSTLWTKPPDGVFIIGGLSAILQLYALFYFLKILWEIRIELKQKLNGFVRTVLLLSLFCLSIKFVLQAVSAIPYFADLAYKIRNFIIAYLHLTLIGVVSLFVIALFQLLGDISIEKTRSRMGLQLFIAGFLLSEILLFAQGISYWNLSGNIPYYYEMLFLVSLSMPVGIALMLIDLRSKILDLKS